MKKHLLTILFLTALASTAFGQYDIRAKIILDGVSANYKLMKGYNAAFDYTATLTSGRSQTLNGEITVKDNKVHLVSGDTKIINNGTSVWTYNKQINEVNITEYDEDDEEISPNKIYDMYKKGYQYQYIGEKTLGGVACIIIELTPEEKGQFTKIEIAVRKGKNEIKSWKMYQKGAVIEYNIKSMKELDNIDNSLFVFNASDYKDVEVIDLR